MLTFYIIGVVASLLYSQTKTKDPIILALSASMSWLGIIIILMSSHK
jgi:hypothetical protein